MTKKHNGKSFPIKQILAFFCCFCCWCWVVSRFSLRVNYESYLIIDSFLSRQCSLRQFLCWNLLKFFRRSLLKTKARPSKAYEYWNKMANHTGSPLNIESVKMNWFAHERWCVFRRSWQHKKPVCQPYHFDIRINKFTTTSKSESSTRKARFLNRAI